MNRHQEYGHRRSGGRSSNVLCGGCAEANIQLGPLPVGLYRWIHAENRYHNRSNMEHVSDQTRRWLHGRECGEVTKA